MENKFLNRVKQGTNKWWQYIVTLIAILISFVIAIKGISLIQPHYKILFPDNDFGKNLGLSILITVIFGVGLITFIIASKKLHKRPFLSYINLNTKFNWTSYFFGFLIWGVLLFASGLIIDYDQFQNFLNQFDLSHFIILFLVGFISIGIQSFFEEVIFRGYFLQGMSLRLKNITILIIVNSLLFALLHFGYGISSFISSFTFAVAFALITIKQQRIEFVSGAHNANNLILSLFFIDLNEALNEEFSWSLDWVDLGTHFIIIAIFIAIAFKLFKK